jgi:ferredoxin
LAHTLVHERVYTQLQERMDRTVTGAPASPTLIQILKLLYSPQEAEIARQLPSLPTPVTALARQLGVPAGQLDDRLSRMAQRGVVLDLSRGDERLYALPPVVIGFFEYTFMRTREDVPLAELAQLFEQYMLEDASFARSVFAGQTQLGRALIHEEALPADDYVEVLDWERTSEVIGSASCISLSLCSCRHKASHLDRACDRPLETCLSLNYGAETIIRMGAGRQISAAEALDIVQEAKALGLAQIGDNVRRRPAYICNCCGCCCGMIQALRTFNLPNAIVTSNWLMAVDASHCKGCGKCVKACPVEAIELVIEQVDGRKRGRAVVNEALCLGCGVCLHACPNGGIRFEPRLHRVYTPETIFEQVIAMAVERGKLADLVLPVSENLGYRALGRIIKVVERSTPARAALAVAPLRSAFLDGVVKAGKAMVKVNL